MRVCAEAGGASSNKARRLLLRQVGKIMDRRSGRNFVGDIPHDRREATDYGDGSGEREARIAHEKACCAPKLATKSAILRLLGSMRSVMADRALQRAVSLHRQFGALDHRRSDLEQARRGKIPRLQRRQPAKGTGPSRDAAPVAKPRLRYVRLSLKVLGRVRRTRRAGSSISSSPSATTPPPKPARCGRASR